MKNRKSANKKKHLLKPELVQQVAASKTSLTLHDLRGFAKLATQATLGVSVVVEGVHQVIWNRLGFPGGQLAGQTRGITGFVFQSIRAITAGVGASTDAILHLLEENLSLAGIEQLDATDYSRSHRREAIVAALNGVMGDHLDRHNNPLALKMRLRFELDRATDSKTSIKSARKNSAESNSSPKTKYLLVIHGLCMNDLQWHGENKLDSADAAETQLISHAHALADAFAYTPIFLHYNSGKHIAENAEELSQQLTQWIANSSIQVSEISVLAHSMGGLLIRSALQIAMQSKAQWQEKISRVVFLGTPHHGAPLERIGNGIDIILNGNSFTRPFAALGQLRSAGITDLRFGLVREQDWLDKDRFEHGIDQRTPTPLPRNIRFFAIAASLSKKVSGRMTVEDLLGDGLVPISSALGQDPNGPHHLAFDLDKIKVVYACNHLELLQDIEVREQILDWFGLD